MLLRIGLAAAALSLAAQGAVAATPEPVRRIPVFVSPYYAAARTPEERPKVEVGRRFDHALASTERGEVVAARDAIEANPSTVTPMTLMVLAIRLYDVGLRDDAVFWFYVARARYEKAAELLGNGDLRVSEIAFAAGFQSLSQFNRVFKKFSGKSPSQYRAAGRAQQKRRR